MPYKNLEHDGYEDFSRFSNREKLNQNRLNKKKKRASKADKLENAQKKYLSPNNPALWEGDLDV